jgi:AcrR family transcriptional regulator
MNQAIPMLKSLVPATARGEATRRKLLSAAEAEFGAKGFHAASVSSITTRAGVGQGTFYLYFHTKEEIFTTLVREIGRALRAHTGQAVARSRNRLEAERLGLEAFLEFALEHPGLYRIVQESQFVDEAVFREYYERLAKGYAKDVADAAERGELSPGDADTRAWAIMGIGHFLGMRHCLWNGQLPGKKVMDEAMAMIERGIGPK